MAEPAFNYDPITIKTFEDSLAGVDIESRVIRGYISTPTMDRDQEFVPVNAFTEDLHIYLSNPILLLFHAHKTLPVGKAIKVEPKEKGLYAEFYISKTPLGNEVLTLCEEGCLRGFSAGFIPKKFDANPEDYKLPANLKGKGVKKYYHRVELVEVSLLAIPSNRDSLILQAEKGNKTAALVVKSFETPGDITHVLAQWMDSVEQKFFNEAEHPRADKGRENAGQFVEDGIVDDVKKVLPSKAQQKVDLAEQVLELQKSNAVMAKDAKRIKNERGFRAWAKKWGIRLGGTLTAYMFFRSKTGRRLSRNSMQYLIDYIDGKAVKKIKDAEGNLDEVAEIALAFLVLKRALIRAQKYVTEGTNEFRQLKTVHDKFLAWVKEQAKAPFASEKGLEDLLKEYRDIPLVTKSLERMLVTYRYGTFGGLMKSVDEHDFGFKGLMTVKSMTPEQFDQNVTEGDIKRDSAGKFAKTEEGKSQKDFQVKKGGFDKEIEENLLTEFALPESFGREYNFYKFYKDNQLKGIVAYSVKEGSNYEGKFAYVTVLSKEPGFGYKMMKYVIPRLSVDTVIWFTTRDNERSIGLAKKLGFTESQFRDFQKTEYVTNADKDDYTLALRLKKQTSKGMIKSPVLKSMTPEQFDQNVVEGDIKRDASGKFSKTNQPRKADGTFGHKTEAPKQKEVKPTTESVKPDVDDVKAYKQSMVTFGKQKGSKFYQWAKENKGKILISAATVPIVFTTAKVGIRSVNILKGKGRKALVNWEEVVEAGKHEELYSFMKPGDVIMSGTMPRESFADVGKDIKQVASYGARAAKIKLVGQTAKVNARGKKPQTGNVEDLAAYDRMNELASKIGGNGQYQHAFLVAGHFDEQALARIKESKNANKIIRDLCINILGELKGKTNIGGAKKQIRVLEEGVKKSRPLMATRVKELFGNDPEYYKKVDLSDFYGHPLRVGTSKGVPNFGLFINPHSGTQTPLPTTVAVVRPKVDEKAIQDITKGVWSDVLNQVQTDAYHPWDTASLLRPMTEGGVLDPVTGKMVRALLRNDRMVCSGVVAKLFERYGHKKFKDASVVSPMSLLRDDKFAKEVLVPRKTKEGIQITTESPKQVVKRDTGGIGEKVLTVGTVGGVGVGTRAVLNKSGEEKGVKEIFTKALTAEQFDRNVAEGDIRRDESGKFTSTGGAAPKPKAQKVGRGGTREGAGRLPKEAHKAVEKVKTRVKEQNPDWSDERIKEEVLKKAQEQGKPDWEEYINRPDEYMNRMKRQAEDIVNTKRNVTYSGGSKITGMDDSSDTDDVVQRLAVSKRSFDRELVFQRTLKKAWDRFRSKDSDEVERNNARMVLALGTIAAGVGIGGLLWFGRPKLMKSGFLGRTHLMKEDLLNLKKLEGNRFQRKKDTDVRDISGQRFFMPKDKRTIDLSHIESLASKSTEVAFPTWFKLLRIVQPPKSAPTGTLSNNPNLQIDMSDIGWFQKKLGSLGARIMRKEEPGEWALSLGTKWHGFKGRFDANLYKVIDRYSPSMTKEGRKLGLFSAYKPEPTDLDALTGIEFIDKEKQLIPISIINIKQVWKQFLKPGKRVPSDNAWNKELLEKHGLGWNDGMEVGRVLYVKDTTKFADFWKDITENTSEEDLLPRLVARARTPQEIEDYQHAADAYMGWAEFLNNRVFGSVARKVIASLSISTGLASGAAYTFLRTAQEGVQERDVAESRYKKAREVPVRQAKRNIAASKSKTERELEYKIEQQKTKQEEAKARREEAKTKRQEDEKEKIKREARETEETRQANEEFARTNLGFQGEIETKSFDERSLGQELDIDAFTDYLADDISKMIEDVSKSCQIVVNSGMPGHELYEDLNASLIRIYQLIKLKAQIAEQREKEEETAGIPAR